MCASPNLISMDALADAREPLVVTFPVPRGLDDTGMHLLIETWYEAIAPYDFVYVGGTSFALNPPCPSPEAARRTLQAAFGTEVRVEVLSDVLRRRSHRADERVMAEAA